MFFAAYVGLPAVFHLLAGDVGSSRDDLPIIFNKILGTTPWGQVCRGYKKNPGYQEYAGYFSYCPASVQFFQSLLCIFEFRVEIQRFPISDA
jgi:hypothetical protein